MFKNRMEERFVVQDQVARFLVTQQLDERFRRAGFRPEHAEDEINVLSSELNPAVGPDDYHTTSAFFIGKPKMG